ncbi:glutamate--tRNA ligase [Candidatus Woesebacteria bacterium]|nr:glutamate--tRNA ligase [Candidatus Woesebacteria bacterium]
MKVRTRMAPSPTGEMHVGSLSISLKNYAFAKKHGGKFILRIEDTDKVREVDDGVEAIQQILKDYSIDWDEGPGIGGEFGPYIQSQRLPIYQEMCQKLVDTGKAYHCFCTRERLEELKQQQTLAKTPPKYDGLCKNLSKEEVAEKLSKNVESVIRLTIPENRDIKFNDLIRGEIVVNSNTINDQVLMKSDGYPTYHLAVVVDDHLMQITHIMRGEEWITSTPKHILLYEAFGWEPPVHAHIPVFLNPDGKGKMSKRKGTVSARSFLERGYLPEALLNFFMILGWARTDEVEIMSLDEYIEKFDPADVSPKSVVFDIKKLDWINGIYIRNLEIPKLKEKLLKFVPETFPTEKLDLIIPLVRERLEKLSDFDELTNFFYQEIEQDKQLLLKKSNPEEVVAQLKTTKEKLEKLIDWSNENLEKEIRALQESNDWKKNQYFMMLRISVTGKKATPPLFETINAIGKELVIKRLDQSISIITKI